jgi:hypothetical protein
MISSLGELAAQHVGDHVQLLAHMVGVTLGEDRADGGRHHLGRALSTPAALVLMR